MSYTVEEESMKKSSCLLVAFAFIAVSFATVSYLPMGVKAATLFVGGGGPGNYTTIQGAITDANAGDTIFVYNGTYYENLVITKTLTLVGEDKDTTVINSGGTSHGAHVSSDWVNITGFTFFGSDFMSEPFPGIQLGYVQNCLITNNTFLKNYYGISLHESHNNTIASNVIADGKQGISIALSNDNKIEDNIIANHLRAIDVHSSVRDVISNNTMIENSIILEGSQVEHWNTHIIDTANTVNGRPVHYWKNETGGTIPSGAGEVILANCTEVVVENQYLHNGSLGIELGFSTDIVMRNNDISARISGITLYFSDRNRIRGNNATDSGSGIMMYFSNDTSIDWFNASGNGAGIFFWHCANNTIENGTFSRNADGINLHYSVNNAIRNNNVTSSVQVGVYLVRSSENTVANNTVTSNTRPGLQMYYSHGNEVLNNIISSNVRFGALLTESDGNVIHSNDLSRNGEYGIFLHNSDNNQIAENRVMQNGGGINLTFSSNNMVFHNNIANNGEQAYDDRDTNHWDDGYPSGGNYWSDYAGIDNCSGPNQDNCPDPDGIGDTPYVIDADSQDRYPLMWPFAVMFPQPPMLLDAVLTGSNLENVTLMWLLSPDDGNVQRPVVEYLVFRGMDFSQGGFGYSLIASIPNGTSAFVDSFVGEGNPNSHFYRICARNTHNKTSCGSNQAGKFTRPLSPGPSLVSVPLIQSDENIETVLQTLNYDEAWSYDTSNGEWKWHMTFKDYRRGLWNMNHTMGVWVNVTEASNLTVAGIVPAQTTIHLHEGWNLVSFPSVNATYTVADLKAETGVTRVEGYDPAPPHFLMVLGDAEVLQAGYGYWVKVVADTIWTVSFA